MLVGLSSTGETNPAASVLGGSRGGGRRLGLSDWEVGVVPKRGAGLPTKWRREVVPYCTWPSGMPSESQGESRGGSSQQPAAGLRFQASDALPLGVSARQDAAEGPTEGVGLMRPRRLSRRCASVSIAPVIQGCLSRALALGRSPGNMAMVWRKKSTAFSDRLGGNSGSPSSAGEQGRYFSDRSTRKGRPCSAAPPARQAASQPASAATHPSR